MPNAKAAVVEFLRCRLAMILEKQKHWDTCSWQVFHNTVKPLDLQKLQNMEHDPAAPSDFLSPFQLWREIRITPKIQCMASSFQPKF